PRSRGRHHPPPPPSCLPASPPPRSQSYRTASSFKFTDPTIHSFINRCSVAGDNTVLTRNFREPDLLWSLEIGACRLSSRQCVSPCSCACSLSRPARSACPCVPMT